MKLNGLEKQSNLCASLLLFVFGYIIFYSLLQSLTQINLSSFLSQGIEPGVGQMIGISDLGDKLVNDCKNNVPLLMLL